MVFLLLVWVFLVFARLFLRFLRFCYVWLFFVVFIMCCYVFRFLNRLHVFVLIVARFVLAFAKCAQFFFGFAMFGEVFFL